MQRTLNVRYTYDALGRLTKVEDDNGQTTSPDPDYDYSKEVRQFMGNRKLIVTTYGPSWQGNVLGVLLGILVFAGALWIFFPKTPWAGMLALLGLVLAVMLAGLTHGYLYHFEGKSRTVEIQRLVFMRRVGRPEVISFSEITRIWVDRCDKGDRLKMELREGRVHVIRCERGVDRFHEKLSSLVFGCGDE